MLTLSENWAVTRGVKKELVDTPLIITTVANSKAPAKSLVAIPWGGVSSATLVFLYLATTLLPSSLISSLSLEFTISLSSFASNSQGNARLLLGGGSLRDYLA